MGNLQKSFRQLKRWKRRKALSPAERETMARLQRTFPVEKILMTLRSPAGFRISEEMMQAGLKMLADRGFVIDLNTWGDFGDELVPAIDWMSLVREMRDHLDCNRQCYDPVFCGVVAFLSLIDCLPDAFATPPDQDLAFNEVMFGLVWLCVSVAVSQSTSPITV